jgi:hypothetical protein
VKKKKKKEKGRRDLSARGEDTKERKETMEKEDRSLRLPLRLRLVS